MLFLGRVGAECGIVDEKTNLGMIDSFCLIIFM